jgi:FKBP-type peptidyl-prolyl cis-trans isomerase SlpA
MTELVVGEGTEITLHFSLKLDSGEVIDSNFEGDPATFTMGDGNMLPGFEKKLSGMVSGEQETFMIKPEDGFGQSNPNNFQSMPRDQFNDVELVEGLMMSFADAQKAELPGVVSAFDDETVTIDFNHPLAGREIIFEAKIVSVVPAVTH